MADETLEIGQRTRELGDFEHSAKKSEDFLKNRSLNPQPHSLKQRLARLFGAAAVAGAAVGGTVVAAQRLEQGMSDPNFGQPVENSQPFDVSFIHSTGENGTDNAPTFRTGPTDTAHELSEEELKEQGIDPTGTARVVEVYGQTYASDGKGFIHNDETRKNHGIWGEIVVTDPNTGQDKPTGIYLSENFISKTDNQTTESK